MTNKTLEQRIWYKCKCCITELELKAIGYDKHDSYGSEVMETAREALEIIEELQQKPCEYIHQGKDGTSFCTLAASHGKELEEARRVIEELRAQLESKNEHISNLINGE